MMTDGGPRRFAIVAEAASDARRGSQLADRVMTEWYARPESQRTERAMTEADQIREMMDGHSLDTFRRWQGLTEHDDFFDIHRTPKEARRRSIKAHGQFNGAKGAKDAHSIRLTLLLFKSVRPAIDALVILRDTDEHPKSTQAGVKQAREKTSVPFPVVVGLPREAMEAWLFAGYVPQGPREHEILEKSRRELGFDPLQKPHKLSHKAHEQHSAKQLMSKLANVMNESFEERCLGASLRELRSRGADAGVAAFFDEVESLLMPLLGA